MLMIHTQQKFYLLTFNSLNYTIAIILFLLYYKTFAFYRVLIASITIRDQEFRIVYSYSLSYFYNIN